MGDEVYPPERYIALNILILTLMYYQGQIKKRANHNFNTPKDQDLRLET